MGACSHLTWQNLRAANVARLMRWHKDSDSWTGADWSNAMCGEAGEAANVVKKLRRHETHIGASYNTPPKHDLMVMLAMELADTIIYADLLAHHYGINLEGAIIAKFNKVSLDQGFPERL